MTIPHTSTKTTHIRAMKWLNQPQLRWRQKMEALGLGARSALGAELERIGVLALQGAAYINQRTDPANIKISHEDGVVAVKKLTDRLKNLLDGPVSSFVPF